jgi:2-methylcitrate dehydratase PrpD
MHAEERMVDWILNARFEDFPAPVVGIVKDQIMTIVGTVIAGASEDGVIETVRFFRELGGKEEATILIHGGRIPAHDAAFINAAMGRALDMCDSMAPGPHTGAALIAGTLAACELVGGVSGADFLKAVIVGNEIAARMNLDEAAYDGFDPTGICVIFGVAAACSIILGLNKQETWNALALAFNRCGGSFQSHIDGSLGVRFVQGWVAQSGLFCVRLAQRKVTGPRNFLEGIYGYLHLYGKDRFSADSIIAGIGNQYRLEKMVYKKYPSCALTQGPVDETLKLMADEGIQPEDVSSIRIKVPPYAHKLVGHEFEPGDNPRVSAQFSIRYCVANALLKRSSLLEHFEENTIRQGEAANYSKRIDVVADKTLDQRAHTAMDMRIVMRDGRVFERSIDIAPGFPGNPLTREDHKKRFEDCLAFAKKPISRQNTQTIVSMIEGLEDAKDVRELVTALS